MPPRLSLITCGALFFCSLAATLALTPLVIRLAWRLGAVDHGGYRKIGGRCVPLMGGLAIVAPLLALCLLGILQPGALFFSLGEHYKDLTLLAAGGLIITILGMVDDIRGLNARDKFSVQIGVALLVCLAGKTIVVVQLPILGVVNLGALGGMILTVTWVVGMINAFNLVDGVDGLATGLGLIAALGLGVVAALNAQWTVVLVCLGLAGSLAGFLVFNFHPARIFLGDTGSLFIGFTLATLALMGSSRTSGSVMLLAPALALGFPIFDTLTSMIRRLLRGRNPFVGDRAHTHHRLLDYGYTQRQVALILYGVALMCAVAGVLCQVLYPRDQAPLVAVGLYALVVMAVAWVNGYLRLRHALRVAGCRTRNSKLESFSRFAAISLRADNSLANLEEILGIGCKELRLRFIEIAHAWNDPDDQENEDEDDWTIAVALRSSLGVNDEDDLDPVETMRVHDAAGRALLVRYQVNHRGGPADSWDENTREADKLEHQDVMACLARLFSSIEVPPADRETGRNAVRRGQVAIVHDIRQINHNRNY